MTNLLVDIGNTRLKWGIDNDLDIISGQAILVATVSRTELIRLWRDIPRPNQIAIACVGSNQLASTVQNVANELWSGIKCHFVNSQAEGFGVKNRYKKPESFGVDRWLGMIAAYHRYQTALCVVGCGTAVTLDFVNQTGQHLGGLICPGLGVMKAGLAQYTENLITVDGAEFPKGLADCTEAAIQNGVLMAISGLIELALNNQGGDVKLILTGGDAEYIAPCLVTPAGIEPNLVLSGLSLTLTMPP